MPRSALTAQSIVASGLKATYSAANAAGHSFPNDGLSILHVKNGGAGACQVTVQTPATVAGLAVEDKVISIPAGEDWFIGRLQPVAFNRPTGAADPNQVYVDFDQVTSVTLALLQP